MKCARALRVQMMGLMMGLGALGGPGAAGVFMAVALGSVAVAPSVLEAAEGPQVLDLLPGSISEELVQKEMRRISRRVGPVTLSEPPALLFRTLQWAVPEPSRNSCYDGDDRPRSKKKPSSSPPRSTSNVPQQDVVFAALLERSRQQILALDTELGLESLKNARSVLPCSDVIIPREQLRALFLQEGVAHFFLKDGEHEDYFFNVLAVDPNTRFDVGGYPTAVRKAFEKVEKKADKRRTVKLINDLEDVEVFLNGSPLEGEVISFPGRHLIQVRGPAGRLRSQLVSIPAALEVPLSEVLDLGLFPLERVREVLVRDVRSNKPDRYTREGLEDYLREQNLPALLFAVEPTTDDRSTLRVYVRDVGMMPVSDYVRNSFRVVSRSEARGIRSRNPVAGVGLASQWILGEAATFDENGRYLGLGIYGDQPLGAFQVGGRLSIFPYRQRPVTSAVSCGEGSGCSGRNLTLTLSGGLGYPVYLTEHLRLTPGIWIEGAYLPEMLLPESGGYPPTQALATILAGGSTGRIELTYTVPFEEIKLEGGLELLGGALVAPYQGEALWLFPVGATLRAGLVF